MNPHAHSIKEVLAECNSTERGLKEVVAKERLKEYGVNELKEGKRISPLEIFVSQFKNLVVVILMVATVISFLLGEFIDAGAITFILILIAIVGFIQEYRAEKEIQALKKLASLKASAIREGKRKEIDAKELVPGDIIILETGKKVPADSRLLEAINLEAQESSLTGESIPVKKTIESLPEKTVLADRTNMVFSSTAITNGRGRAIVTNTGMQTEIGKIAALIQETPQELTPLQKKLDKLGKLLGKITIFICIAVFFTDLLTTPGSTTLFFSGDFIEFLRVVKDSFLIAVALAVAAIPEGLPAVVTISLSLGTRRMLERNTLIRRLPSVETLGETTVICSDKTGTLTMNQMTVKKIFVDNVILEVSGAGYETKGSITRMGKPVKSPTLSTLLLAGLLNNDAELKGKEVMGDPTEGALLVSAAKAGLTQGIMNKRYPRKDEIPFSSERKMMTTLHSRAGEQVVFSKGATEVILNLCTSIEINGKIKKLTEQDRLTILERNQEFAENGLRVLAFAHKTLIKSKAEEKLTFLGLQAMRDPPRPEVPDAIKKCRQAGIKVVMITGDHQITAKAIGETIGLEGKSVTGAELDKMGDFSKKVEDIAIYARVNPEHKIKIVSSLKKKGHHIVAMTGDGVNDAPALKKSDIGVAMGIIGTDVSKEASDAILTDDNFASIVNAVEEGRGIYDNIRNYVQYLLSSNIGEVLIIFLALLMGLPLPLVAIQILLMNLVTDGAPAIALSVEPNEKDIMKRKPRKPGEPIVSHFMAVKMIVLSLGMTLITLTGFLSYLEMPCINCEDPHAYARTFAFTTLVLLQMFNVLNSKSDTESVFKTGLFTNKWLLVAIFSSILIQVFVVQWMPLINTEIFKTIPLTLVDWVYAAILGSFILIIGELLKYVNRKFNLFKE